MKINKVAVSSKDLTVSVKFYQILGFEFPEFGDDEQHVESINTHEGSTLMIDTDKLLEEISQMTPRPGSHSAFAIEYSTKEEVDKIAQLLEEHNFTVFKQPWEAFWGQYYCIVEDPYNHKIDLYVNL